LNAFAERFVLSIKEECLSRMIFLGQASLRHGIAQYTIHYHGERNHQGLVNRIPKPNFDRESGHRINRRIRLGGMLSYYHRQAASPDPRHFWTLRVHPPVLSKHMEGRARVSSDHYASLGRTLSDIQFRQKIGEAQRLLEIVAE
jgi:hypothetical protein